MRVQLDCCGLQLDSCGLSGIVHTNNEQCMPQLYLCSMRLSSVWPLLGFECSRIFRYSGGHRLSSPVGSLCTRTLSAPSRPHPTHRTSLLACSIPRITRYFPFSSLLLFSLLYYPSSFLKYSYRLLARKWLLNIDRKC